MFNYISIMSNNSILKEKFNNKSLDDNYIKNLISLYDLNHNKSDLMFYVLIHLILFIQCFYKNLTLPQIIKTFKKNKGLGAISLIVFFIGVSLIYYSIQTVPTGQEANSKIIKNIFYPVSIIALVIIFAISILTGSKKNSIIYICSLIGPFLLYFVYKIYYLLSDNISKKVNKIINIIVSVYPIVYLVILFFIGAFRKKDLNFNSSDNILFSMPIWLLSFLLLGRVFKYLNLFIIYLTSGNYKLVKRKNNSVLSSVLQNRLSSIIQRLKINKTENELFKILNNYEIQNTSKNFFSILSKFKNYIYYSINSILNFIFYYIIGSTINNDSTESKHKIDQVAFPILGFNNNFFSLDRFINTNIKYENNNVSSFFNVIIGVISTKILLNGFATNGNVASIIISAVITGIKSLMVVVLGNKFHRWYEGIINKDQTINISNSIKYILFQYLYTGIDLEKTGKIYNKNKSDGILTSGLFFKNTGFKLISFLIVGILVSLFSSLDYFTNNNLIAMILSIIKLVPMVGFAIYWSRKKK